MNGACGACGTTIYGSTDLCSSCATLIARAERAKACAAQLAEALLVEAPCFYCRNAEEHERWDKYEVLVSVKCENPRMAAALAAYTALLEEWP